MEKELGSGRRWPEWKWWWHLAEVAEGDWNGGGVDGGESGRRWRVAYFVCIMYMYIHIYMCVGSIQLIFH